MMDVLVMEGPDGSLKGRINQVLTFEGLERVQADRAPARATSC
jgi:GTP-binding protein